MLPDQVRKTIQKHKLTEPGARVLVAVSGGPDSIALLHVFHRLHEELGLHLEIAHLQHGLRGEDAEADAVFVGGLAARLGLPFHLRSVSLPRLKAEAGRGNMEALARLERYRFFADLARSRDLGRVATAHTQDDQAETVLMWFLRGCGRKGLGGFAPVQRLAPAEREPSLGATIIRPLLDVSKTEVLEYLHQNNIEYRLDKTNEDPNLLRNWIRLRLIPQLREKLDRKLPARLSRQAEMMRQEERFLARLALQKLLELQRETSVDRKLFLKEDRALQRLMLRCWIERTRGHLRGIDYDHIETLLDFIAGDTPQGQLSIPGGWRLVREYEHLTLERTVWGSGNRVCYGYQIQVGEKLDVQEAGVIIESDRLSRPLPDWPGDLMTAVFDGARLPGKLLVRNFRHGDRFQPLGMSGHKKLKDLFIENKVPLSVRRTLPVIVDGSEILWIPGYGRSGSAKVTPETEEIVRLRAQFKHRGEK